MQAGGCRRKDGPNKRNQRQPTAALTFPEHQSKSHRNDQCTQENNPIQIAQAKN
jgi:hypothetical protein